MAIPSDGSYGIPKGLIFSYPVECKANYNKFRMENTRLFKDLILELNNKEE